MDAVLLDTDVFSFFFKKDTRREPYLADIRGRLLCVSFMTVAELKKWSIKHSWSEKRRESLAQVLKHYVVLPYDDIMAET